MPDYRYWIEALRITNGLRPLTREEMARLGISEDEISCGFYRVRSGPREPFSVPVAIWMVGTTEEEHRGDIWPMMLASINGKYIEPHDVWLQACKFPVREEVWRRHALAGTWPETEEV